MSKLLRKIKNGFTLVELIVVIAIIAILAAVSVGGYFGFLAYANQSAADQEAQQFKTAVLATTSVNYHGRTLTCMSWSATNNNKGIRFYSDTGSEPTEQDVLGMLCEAYTYSEAPATFVAGSSITDTGLLYCTGVETDGTKAALLSPTLSRDDNNNYYITGVTYQSKKKISSVVSFTNSKGEYQYAVASAINVKETPTSIAYNGGLKSSYFPNEEIDFSKVTALVTFPSGQQIVGAKNLNITISDGSKTYTYKGLHRLFGSSSTSYTLKIEYKQTIDSTSIPVNVSKTIKSNGDIKLSGEAITPTELEYPANVIKSINTKAIDPNSVGGFKDDSNYVYTVGKENNLIFNPRIIGLDSTTGERIYLNNNISYELYDENNNSLIKSNIESTDYNSLDFSSVSADTNYTLRFSCETLNKTLKVRVVDAYNVYSQEDLGQFDNTTASNYANHGNEFTANDEKGNMWKDFKDCSFHDYANAVKGLVLQNDINVVPNKLPTSMFENDGSLKDAISIYRRCLGDGGSFTFEGNYFTIDASTLPVAKQKEGAENKDIGIQPHLFAVTRDYNSTTGFNYHAEYADSCTFKHASFKGNAPKASEEALLGGIKMISNFTCLDFNVDYCNGYKSFVFIDLNNNGGGLKFTNSKAYDCFNSFIYNYGTGKFGNRARTMVAKNSSTYNYDDLNCGTIINNCEMVSCGGPAIISNSVGVYSTWWTMPTVNITNSNIVSMLSGSEPWFSIMGFPDIAKQFLTLDSALVRAFSNRSITKNGMFNAISVMICDKTSKVTAPNNLIDKDIGFAIPKTDGIKVKNTDVSETTKTFNQNELEDNLYNTYTSIDYFPYVDYNHYENNESYIPGSIWNSGTIQYGFLTNDMVTFNTYKDNGESHPKGLSFVPDVQNNVPSALIELTTSDESPTTYTTANKAPLENSSYIGIQMNAIAVTLSLYNQ